MDVPSPHASPGSSETTASGHVAVAPVQLRRFGHYVVVAKLGQGGMCEVHLALHEGPSGFRKLVALKRLFPHLEEDPAAVEMLLDEGRIAARLAHPNTVQTHEVGDVDGTHFLAMEYLAGHPFHRLLQRAARGGDRLPTRLSVRVIADALDGLHHAHELLDYDGTPLGVVHRDVSPHNLFVTYDGVTKLLDFGIAKAGTQEAVTRVGMVKGKFAYIAPEQARGEPVDRRADLWAIGVVAWEAIAGHRLFKADNEAATLERALTLDIPDLRSVTPDAPPAIAELVARALRRDPEARPGTALEMREVLESWLAREGHGESRSALRDHMRGAFAGVEHEQRALVKRCVERATADPPPEGATPAAAGPTAAPAAPNSAPGVRRGVSARGWLAPAFGGGLAALLIGALAFLAFGDRTTGARDPREAAGAIREEPPASTARSTDPPPVEPVELTADDVPPRLVEGTPPPAPTLGALAPTITTRVLLDARGRVRDARVFGSRPDLAAFERAALRAVRRYRFEPARRGDEPIAAWTPVPVRFEPIDDRPKRLRIKGSDTIGGALGPDLAQGFMTSHPEVAVTVEALGSSTAFSGLFDGSADLGASSRAVSARELQEAESLGLALREFVIAYDGIAVVVHADNPVRSMTLAQLRDVFRGDARRWDEVGGEGAPIRVLSRPGYSGTHAFFRDAVLAAPGEDGRPAFGPRTEVVERNDRLLALVGRDPTAMGYVGLGWIDDALPVHTLAVAREAGDDAVAPSLATIRADRYPIARPLMFYTAGAPRGLVADFLRFVFSAEGREIITGNGYAAANASGDLGGDPGRAHAHPREVRRIYFTRGGTRPDEASEAKLEELAALLADGTRHALVVGHADAGGRRGVNQRLATARAEEVVRRLAALGVPPERMEATSAAAEQPLASNATASGRRANRRVDVLLVSD